LPIEPDDGGDTLAFGDTERQISPGRKRLRIFVAAGAVLVGAGIAVPAALHGGHHAPARASAQPSPAQSKVSVATGLHDVRLAEQIAAAICNHPHTSPARAVGVNPSTGAVSAQAVVPASGKIDVDVHVPTTHVIIAVSCP
jgi:hypothetical protein